MLQTPTQLTGISQQQFFSGKIERNLPLSSIMRVLSSGNINLKVQGKKLIVE